MLCGRWFSPLDRESLLIEEIAGSDWFDQLSEERKAAIEEVYADRRSRNAETTLMDCLYLSDKVNLSRHLAPIREAVGIDSVRKFKELGSKIISLRNPLAHCGSILHAAPDPEEAVARFSMVRGTATRLWAYVYVAEPRQR